MFKKAIKALQFIRISNIYLQKMKLNKNSLLKIVIIITTFFSLSNISSAEKQISIAVLNPSYKLLLNDTIDEIVSNLESEFNNVELFRLVSRESIVTKYHLKRSSYNCRNNFVKSRLRKLHVDLIVCGRVTNKYGKYIIELKLIDLDYGQKLSSLKQGCRGCSETQLAKSMQQIGRSLIKDYLNKHRRSIHKFYPDYNIDQILLELRNARNNIYKKNSNYQTSATAAKQNAIEEKTPQAKPTSKAKQHSSSARSINSEITNRQRKSSNEPQNIKEKNSSASNPKVLDFHKVNLSYNQKKQTLILTLLVLMLLIVIGIITLNYYRKQRFDVKSSTEVITLAELQESEHPKGMIRCTITREERQHETYFFAPPVLIVGYDPTDIYDSQKPHLNIGLEPQIGVNLEKSKLVDKRHGKFDFNQDGVHYTDLGSQNGSFINNKKCEPGERYYLKDGSVIGLAGVHELKISYDKDFDGNVLVAFLTRLNNASRKIDYMLLIKHCYFTLGEEYTLEWTGEKLEDSLVEFYFKNKNFWIQSQIDYPPIMLDSERLPARSKRRLNRLHSTLELQNIHILINDLTMTL